MRLTAFLLVFAPTILLGAVSREAAFSTPRFGPAVGSQTLPVIASRGDEHFVAWFDARSEMRTALFGSRVDAAGSILNPTGVRITSAGRILSHRVLPHSGGWVVFWCDGNLFIRARLISRDGVPAGPEQIVGRTPSHDPTVGLLAATNGETFFISGSGSASVPALLLDRDLRVQQRIEWWSLGLTPEPGAVASDGTDYLLAGRRIGATPGRAAVARVTRRGEPEGEARTAVAGDVVRLVWSGRDYALVFRSGAATNLQRLERDGATKEAPLTLLSNYLAILGVAARDGEVFIPSFSPVSSGMIVLRVRDGTLAQERVTANRDQYFGADIAAGPSSTIVVWSATKSGESPGLRAARLEGLVSPFGDTSETTVSATAQSRPAAARHGGGTIALWEERDGTGVSRLFVRDVENASESARLLEPGACSQYEPAIASSGETALAVWVERCGRRSAIVALLLDRDGRPAGAPFDIAGNDAFSFDYSKVSLVWNGGYYFVAFSGGAGEFRIARVTSNGVLIDRGGREVVPSRPGAFNPTLVTGGDDTFLLWDDPKPTGPCCQRRVAGIQLSPSGFPVDPQPVILSPDSGESLRAAVWSGSDLVIAWSRGAVLFATRVSPRFTIAPGDDAFVIGPARFGAVSMFALNDHVLVAWPQDADDDPASFLGKIVAARLRGRRTDLPFAVTSLFAGHLNPYAFFTTRGAAVAFQRFSGVAATEEVSRLHYVLVDVAPPPARMRVAQ